MKWFRHKRHKAVPEQLMNIYISATDSVDERAHNIVAGLELQVSPAVFAALKNKAKAILEIYDYVESHGLIVTHPIGVRPPTVKEVLDAINATS